MIHGVCPECGSKKKKHVSDDYEDLVEGIEISIDGGGRARLNPNDEMSDLFSNEPTFDENGEAVLNDEGIPEVKRVKKKIPYYKPNIYPVILRKNISEEDKFLGGSDVSVRATSLADTAIPDKQRMAAIIRLIILFMTSLLNLK